MTPDQWFMLLRDVAMGMTAVLVFYWGRDRKAAEDAVKALEQHVAERLAAELKLRDQRLEEHDRRLNQGSEKMSTLTGTVQRAIGQIGIQEEQIKMLRQGREEWS